MRDDRSPAGVPLEEIRIAAVSLAQQLKAAGSKPLPADLRQRFIEVRAALFLRGVFDPVLVRFDSATVPHASAAELADELEAVAASL
jgi:hypothetical protein